MPIDGVVSATNNTACHSITMTSTNQLAVGVRLSRTELKAKWFKFNHDSGYDTQIVQNISKPKARYLSICYSAPKKGWKKAYESCRAHIWAVGDTSDEMEITSIDLTHSCGRNDKNKRKRNYRTKEICNVSDILSVYEPAKGGNAKQFAKMA